MTCVPEAIVIAAAMSKEANCKLHWNWNGQRSHIFYDNNSYIIPENGCGERKKRNNE